MSKYTIDDYYNFINGCVTFDDPEKAVSEERIRKTYDERWELVYKLCEALCRKFGTKIRIEGRFPANERCAGVYFPYENCIRVYGSELCPIAWKTIAHELGHVISDRYCLFYDPEESLLAENFDPEQVKREITDHYDAIQRHCFAPFIKVVENVYGAGAFDVILNHSREHVDYNRMLYYNRKDKAEALLRGMEENGYADALVKYIPIIKQNVWTIGAGRNFVITDLFGAYYNLEYLTHESHTLSYYQGCGFRNVDELFANLTISYLMDRSAYDGAGEYLPETVALHGKIMDLVFADLGIDKTQYRCDSIERNSVLVMPWYTARKEPESLELNGTIDDAPKIRCILQRNACYKTVFRKNHRYSLYVKMYDFYHERLSSLIESGALSEKEFSKLVNNGFIVPFYEYYKNPSFVKGMGEGEFLRLWKEYIPKKYVKDTRDLFSKTKYDLVLVMFAENSTEKAQERELKLVKKGQPDAEVRVGHWNYPETQEVLFLKKTE